MQMMYLGGCTLVVRRNRHEISGFRRGEKWKKVELRIFSLLIFWILGIFCPPAYGGHRVVYDASSSDAFVASFNFNLGEFSSRKVNIEEASFNASGTIATFSPIALWISDYSSWHQNYGVESWNSVLSSGPVPVSTEKSIQIRQIPQGTTMSLSAGVFLFSRIDLGLSTLSLYAYNSESDVLLTPIAGFPKLVATNVSDNVHAMVITKNKCHLFWVGTDNRIHTRTFDGTSFSAESIFANNDVNYSYGVSSCLINAPSGDYVALTYAASPTLAINVVTFKESAFPTTATESFNPLSIIDSRVISITQNPRTKAVYLYFIDSAKVAKYVVASFSTISPWPQDPIQSVPGTWVKAGGNEICGFTNFETSLAGNDFSITKLRDVLIETPVTPNGIFGTSGFPSFFQYTNSGKDYAGLVFLKGFTDYEFHRRLLRYPQKCVWKADTKVLQIQGPPLLNTPVSVAVDFAEASASLSLVSAANSGGLKIPIHGATGVIAGSGTQFTIVFDKAMMQASFTEWVGSGIASQIKLWNAASVPVGITWASDNSQSVTFTTNADLAFDSDYHVTIASNVLDSGGTQLWGPATFSFRTQKMQSGALASEVIGLQAFDDSARSIPIANNSEINATTTLYFKFSSVDPAFNTIDLATISYSFNGSFIASIPFAQLIPATTTFLAATTTIVPWGGSHTLSYETTSPTAVLTFFVNFPTLNSQSPTSGSANVALNSSIVMSFSETVDSATVVSPNLRLLRNGSLASYSLTTAGNIVTLDPDDSSEGYLAPETSYTLLIGRGIRDLAGNPFFNSPATYSSVFTTQASQTAPTAIASVSIYSDPGYSVELPTDADFAATGTIYIEMRGTDGATLTLDVTVASLSNGTLLTLNEVASNSGIFRGQSTFAGLADGFRLRVQSTVSPTAGQSLLISYPKVVPLNPASGAVNVPVNSSITIQADEILDSAYLTATTTQLLYGGASVPCSISFNGATKVVTLTPVASLTSSGFYTVQTAKIRDLAGNPLLSTLEYTFTALDIISPSLVSMNPASGVSGVAINTKVNLTFSEIVASSSISTSTIKLMHGGSLASYAITLGGNLITLDPDDTSEGWLLPETSYLVLIGPDVKDPTGNSFYNVPATYSALFQTQASQTSPISIASVSIFSDPGYTVDVAKDSDYPATGTIYIEMRGTDGSNLTLDSTTASLSNGVMLTLVETASNTGKYRGQVSFSSLADGFRLVVQSAKTPSASQSLLISYPRLTPTVPASGAINVPVDSQIKIQANEPLDSTVISATTTHLLFGGNPVSASINYDVAGRVITITPTASLTSSGLYVVDVFQLKDLAGNTQIASLTYSFYTKDVISPVLIAQNPGGNESGVTIDRRLTYTFSEPILPGSVTAKSFRVFIGGIQASYTWITTGNSITVDPDDGPDHGLMTASSYTVQIGSWVTDFAGNSFSNIPATFTTNFYTQPKISPPLTITALNLFRDASRLLPFSALESISATSSVYLKLSGVDVATQTMDVSTLTLALSWTSPLSFIVNETASNSGGIFYGESLLAGFPIYGFPGPLPPISYGTLSWFSNTNPTMEATLTVRFPAWVPASSTVQTLLGVANASGANQVRLDSSILIALDSSATSESVNASSVMLTQGGTTVSAAVSLDGSGKSIEIIPAVNLAAGKTYYAAIPYSNSGVKNFEGNPIFRPISFSFNTQNTQTPPISISRVSLFPDANFTLFSDLQNDSDFQATGTVYIEMEGIDSSNLTADLTIASLSNGSFVTLVETGLSTGIFRGSASFSALPDRFRLTIESVTSPGTVKSLYITYPHLTITEPASGTTGVSIYTTVYLFADEDLDSSSVGNASVKLMKSGTQIGGNVSYATDSRRITFTPQAALELGATYTVKISDVRDRHGNPQFAPILYEFYTQNQVITPVSIQSLKFYINTAYSIELLNNSFVNPGQEIYAEISAVDISSGTTDYTLVESRSIISGASFTTALVETTPSSGIFRNAIQVFQEENAQIKIMSLADPLYFGTFRTPLFPRIISINPASGTQNLPWDTIFKIQTNKNVDSATLNNAGIRLADRTGVLTPDLQLTAPNEITVDALLASESTVFLESNGNLKDTDGLSFSNLVASYSTLTASYGPFELFADSGFANRLNEGSTVDPAVQLWAQLFGSDSKTRQLETVSAMFSDETTTSTFLLTEDTGGRYRGNFQVPNSPGKKLAVTSVTKERLMVNLMISELFAVRSVSPASGAISVPADVWPTWEFTFPLDQSYLTPTHFTLKNVQTSQFVGGTLFISVDGRSVTLKPSVFLNLLEQYELMVESDVSDTLGRSLGAPFITRFTVQQPPPPPSKIRSLLNYRDSGYTATTTAVTSDNSLFIEVRADDVSFSTIDSTRVRIDSSDGQMTGIDLQLIETTVNSGIFRGSIPISASEGAKILIQSHADQGFTLEVGVYAKPRIVSMNPASGSIDLFLDNSFVISFNNAMDVSTINGGGITAENNGKTVSILTSLSGDGTTVTIEPRYGWATGAAQLLRFSSSILDVNGLAIAPVNFSFLTRSPQITRFELYTGIPPLGNQPVSHIGEIVPGQIFMLASTTDLFTKFPETRSIRFQDGSVIWRRSFMETATQPGTFIGSTNLFIDRGKNATATLEFGPGAVIAFRVAELPSLLKFYPTTGSKDNPENIVIGGRFNRRMWSEGASQAVNLLFQGISVALVPQQINPFSYSLGWKPVNPLVPGGSYLVESSSLIDSLGQSVEIPRTTFTVVGSQGISIFEDKQFKQPILGNILPVSEAYIEVTASGPFVPGTLPLFVKALTQQNATAPIMAPLAEASTATMRFRGHLYFEQTRSVPSTFVSLVPGEKLEITSPSLTSDKRILYYRTSGETSPQKIKALNLYTDKHFARPVETELSQTAIYVEIQAEDLNWLSSDTTMVKVVSDSDPCGFEFNLRESGIHTGSFRNSIALDFSSTVSSQRRLRVQAGDYLTFSSLTDSQVSVRIKFMPQNRIDNAMAWPSPARNNFVTFSFFLTFPGDVDLTVYDTAGDEVHSASINGQQGENRIKWNFPRKLANGVYIFVLELHVETSFKSPVKKVKGKFAVLR